MRFISKKVFFSSTLAFIFIAAYIAFAWTEPTLAPPTGNLTFNASPWVETGNDIYYNTGNVGIGTPAPQMKLHMWSGEVGGSGDQEVLRLQGNWVDVRSGPMIRFTNQHNSGDNPNAGEYNLAAIIGTDDNSGWGGGLIFQTAPIGDSGGANLVDRMIIKPNGNVGIGTTSPLTRLHINGPSNETMILDAGVSDAGLVLKGRSTDHHAALRFRRADVSLVSPTVDSAKIQTYDGDLRISTGGTAVADSPERIRITATGNVGIGTTSPVMPLDVNGSIKSKNYSVNIAEFKATDYGRVYESDPNRHLVKIKTNISYISESMPALFIEGYDYGGGNTFGIDLVWYVYNGAFINYKASSYGSIAPKITLANEGGKVVILLEKPVGQRWYYSRFTIRALLSLGDPSWLQGWTFAPEPITGTNVVVVPIDNAFGNGYFAGNVGIGTASPQAKLEVNGGVRLNTTDAKPACDDSKRGMLWFTNGGAGNDNLEICMKTGATPTWKNL